MYNWVMKKNQQGFGAIEVLLVIIIIGVLGFIGWYVWHRNNISDNPKGTGKSLLIEIKDLGSTNAKGWDLIIYTDGSGKVVGSKDFASSTFNASQLRQSLDSTKLNSQYSCIRSASFGSVEILTYKNKVYSGIDCYIRDNPNTALYKRLSTALQKANL
jgi:prepilin-type N-terminal cleavage/methylation domain-containing protein